MIRGFSSEGYIDGKNDRRLDDCIRYCIVAGKEALEDTDLGGDKRSKGEIEIKRESLEWKNWNIIDMIILNGEDFGRIYDFEMAMEEVAFYLFVQLSQWLLECSPQKRWQFKHQMSSCRLMLNTLHYHLWISSTHGFKTLLKSLTDFMEIKMCKAG